MANDLTFGMDVVIDKILGLGQFDALGKKLQSVVAKAVEAGLLQGVPEARESLRGFYGKSDVAGRNSALKRLYAYSAKVEADEIKRANKEAADQKKKEDKQREREWIKMLDDRDKYEERKAKFDAAEAAYKLYSPYSTTSATASYAEATIARQNLQYLTRITNRDLIDEEGLRSATTQQLIERSRANWEAKNIRHDLPFNRLAREVAEAERQSDRNSWRVALQSDEALARQILEAELGRPVGDMEWQQRKYDELYGANKVQDAWVRGGATSWERTEEAKRRAELKGMRSDSAVAFGGMITEADEASESLARLGKAAQVANLVLSGASALFVANQHTMYAQMASRDITTSKMLDHQLTESKGQILGGALGGYIGLMAGGFLGGAIGATLLGGLGGLWGNYKQKELDAVLKTVTTTTAARRDYLTFGGKSGFALGQAMEDAGFGGASDLNNMRWTGRTLPGAMALGMVGEQDMLMLSLMPEYFAALMGGADAATLAQAYSTSVGRLPAQLQPLVSTMAPGGSQGMYANALDPQFGNMLRYSGEFATRDRFFVGASEYTTAGSIKRANKNINLAYAGVGKDLSNAMSGAHGDYFDMNYMSPAAGWASSTVLSAHSSRIPGAAEGVFALYETSLKNAHMAENTIKELSKIAETGLNLTIRVEGLGDLTQNFPFAAMSNGQTVSFNIGGM